MKTMGEGMKRDRLAAMAALLCALVAVLAVAAAPAAAEESGPSFPEYAGTQMSSPIRELGERDEFSWRVVLGKGQRLRLVTETEAWVEYAGGVEAFAITAEPARDRAGAYVPTTLQVAEGDVLTLVVHDREGNPANGGAPFTYPIVPGASWGPSDFVPIVVKGPPDEKEIAEEKAAAAQRAKEAQEAAAAAPATPPAPAPAPAPVCTVPSLRGLDLRTAKAKLRAEECGVGRVYLARGATAGRGRVVKQFRPSGSRLVAGAPVAVKLAAR
jgi:pyruvate/2-oxoglutarate dehydrogenase complex dihydrolipoamide acyltransferase (E2) component